MITRRMILEQNWAVDDAINTVLDTWSEAFTTEDVHTFVKAISKLYDEANKYMEIHRDNWEDEDDTTRLSILP